MTDFQQELDVRDKICPKPVMKTKQTLNTMSSGEVLHVMASDPTSEEDIGILLNAMEDKLIDSHYINGTYHFYIKKR